MASLEQILVTGAVYRDRQGSADFKREQASRDEPARPSPSPGGEDDSEGNAVLPDAEACGKPCESKLRLPGSFAAP